MRRRSTATPMGRLKAATAAAHRATEATALARAMAAGTVSRRHYALHLQVFRVLVGDLERRLAEAGGGCGGARGAGALEGGGPRP